MVEDLYPDDIRDFRNEVFKDLENYPPFPVNSIDARNALKYGNNALSRGS